MSAAAAAMRRPVLRAARAPAASRRGESSALRERAQQGLSRVTSAAGPAVGRAVRGLSGALGRVGGPMERGIAFAKREISMVDEAAAGQPPVVAYYSRVGLELGKLIFQGQKMNLPPLATFQTFYQNMWHSIRTGSIVRAPLQLLQQARSLSTAQLVTGGVVAAECLGFFSVGEIIGRFKLVGYRGETAHHHH